MGLLQKLYLRETMSKLIVLYSELRHLKDVVLTKRLSKFESTNSKHMMQQTISSIKGIFKELDENEINQNQMVDTPQTDECDAYDIVYHSDCDETVWNINKFLKG